MKVLKDILYGVSINQLQGSTIKEVQDVYFDSRKVGPQSLFVATKGVQVDGHDCSRKKPSVANGWDAPVAFDCLVVTEELPRLSRGSRRLHVADSAY